MTALIVNHKAAVTGLLSLFVFAAALATAIFVANPDFVTGFAANATPVVTGQTSLISTTTTLLDSADAGIMTSQK